MNGQRPIVPRLNLDSAGELKLSDLGDPQGVISDRSRQEELSRVFGILSDGAAGSMDMSHVYQETNYSTEYESHAFMES
jgi:hypothetical protein